MRRLPPGGASKKRLQTTPVIRINRSSRSAYQIWSRSNPHLMPFSLSLVLHVTMGAVGLMLRCEPVVGRKGGQNHRKFGKVFP